MAICVCENCGNNWVFNDETLDSVDVLRKSAYEWHQYDHACQVYCSTESAVVLLVFCGLIELMMLFSLLNPSWCEINFPNCR